MQFPARYTDGQTSHIRNVMIEIYPRGIIIHSDGVVLAKWPYTSMSVSQDWKNDIGGTIAYQKTLGATLTFDDRQGFENIRTRLELKHRATYKIPLTLPAVFLSLIGAALVVAVGFPLYGKISENAVHLIPLSTEKALGNHIIASFEDDFALCKDKAAQEKIEQIVDRLVNASGEENLDIEVHIIRHSMVNAFALPGQHMILMTGFLQKAESEEEIAGVIAHEMGHLIHRDAMRMTLQHKGYNIMLSLITGGGSSYSGIAQIATMANILRYSREKENVADDFAAKLLPKAGYSTHGLATFLRKIAAADSDGVMKKLDNELSFLSTHPATKERLSRLQLSRDSITTRNSLSTDDLTILKNACRHPRKAAEEITGDKKTD